MPWLLHPPLLLIFWYMMGVLARLNCLSSSLFSLRFLKSSTLAYISLCSSCYLNIPLCSKSELPDLYRSKHIRAPDRFGVCHYTGPQMLITLSLSLSLIIDLQLQKPKGTKGSCEWKWAELTRPHHILIEQLAS